MDDTNLYDRFPAAAIFCNDSFLNTFQLPSWRPHVDSKTLVDRPLRMHPEQALSLFNTLPHPLLKDAAITFLNSIFHDSPDHDAQILPHKPVDYNNKAPSFTYHYPKAVQLRDFAADLKRRWNILCRKFSDGEPSSPADITDIAYHPHHRRFPSDPKSSLIKLPYPFFVPGGRFREVYYWDSLWIVHGLIASDMVESAKNLVRNLLYLVKELGFVPNGNRVYYLNRSQPPLLPEAVYAVCEALPDENEKRKWIEETLPTLEKEYYAFMDCRRAVDTPSTTYSPLAVYRVNNKTPRPESYLEDVHTAAAAVRLNESVPAVAERNAASEARRAAHTAQVYQDIASGAESGWDFSSRWLRDPKHGLPSIHTSKIIPTCLNSVLLRNEKLLQSFHSFLLRTMDAGASTEERRVHEESIEKYGNAFTKRSAAMMRFMWSDKSGLWMDYDSSSGMHTQSISVAGLMPVWAGAFQGHWTSKDASQFVETVMDKCGLVRPGGVAATTTPSKEQWDFPNGWTPLLDFVVTGLSRLHANFPDAGAGAAAEEIAMRGVRAMYNGWRTTTVMHEKYDVQSVMGIRGEGGEYEPQDGFGWTNGVALKLMQQYAKEIDEAAPGRWFS